MASSRKPLKGPVEGYLLQMSRQSKLIEVILAAGLGKGLLLCLLVATFVALPLPRLLDSSAVLQFIPNTAHAKNGGSGGGSGSSGSGKSDSDDRNSSSSPGPSGSQHGDQPDEFDHSGKLKVGKSQKTGKRDRIEVTVDKGLVEIRHADGYREIYINGKLIIKDPKQRIVTLRAMTEKDKARLRSLGLAWDAKRTH